MYEFVNVLKEYFITLGRVKRKSCLDKRKKIPQEIKREILLTLVKHLQGKRIERVC